MIGQEAELQKADITVQTSYPWEGKTEYRVTPKTNEEFTLAIHIPYYVDTDSEETSVTVNGEPLNMAELMEKGYVYITRKWKEGDKVSVHFPMEVRKVYANQNVREDAGCVALLRGPIVYCLEGVDNGKMLQSLRIPRDLNAVPYVCEDGVLRGNVLLRIEGWRMVGGQELYSEKRPVREKAVLTAIPYYTWANRGENQMRVWILEE